MAKIQCAGCQKEIEQGWKACPHCGVQFTEDGAIIDNENTVLRKIVNEELDKRNPRPNETAIPQKNKKKSAVDCFIGELL